MFLATISVESTCRTFCKEHTILQNSRKNECLLSCRAPWLVSTLQINFGISNTFSCLNFLQPMWVCPDSAQMMAAVRKYERTQFIVNNRVQLHAVRKLVRFTAHRHRYVLLTSQHANHGSTGCVEHIAIREHTIGTHDHFGDLSNNTMTQHAHTDPSMVCYETSLTDNIILLCSRRVQIWEQLVLLSNWGCAKY